MINSVLLKNFNKLLSNHFNESLFVIYVINISIFLCISSLNSSFASLMPELCRRKLNYFLYYVHIQFSLNSSIYSCEKQLQSMVQKTYHSVNTPTLPNWFFLVWEDRRYFEIIWYFFTHIYFIWETRSSIFFFIATRSSNWTRTKFSSVAFPHLSSFSTSSNFHIII